MKWLRFLPIFLAFFGSVFAEQGPTPEQISYYKAHQESIREQESVELTGEVLFLTSSLSTTYSEAAVIYNLGMFSNPVPAFNQKDESINPEYNFGYRINSTSVIADIASRDKDTFILAGPYFRLTVGF